MAAMGIQKTAHQALPPSCPQYLFEHGKAALQKILDVIVDERSIYAHAPRFDPSGKRIGLGIADMRGERILEALEFRKRAGHRIRGLYRHAVAGWRQCARLHARAAQEAEY